MRHPEFSPSQLPPEWLKAIRGAQSRGTAPDRSLPAARESRAGEVPAEVYAHSAELQALIDRLKRERIERGMSLSDIAGMSQQARSAISRLENGKYGNPTLNTLYRYAHALGVHIRLTAEPIADEPGTETKSRSRGREG